CVSNSRQAVAALTLAATDDDGQILSRFSSPAAVYSQNGAVNGNFTYYQAFLVDNYVHDEEVMKCPSESTRFILRTVWAGNYFAHMSLVDYNDWDHRMNGAVPWNRGNTWGRGHW